MYKNFGLLFVFFIFLSIPGFTQQETKKLDISFTNNTLVQCFDALEKQSGVHFFYDAAEVRKVQQTYSKSFKQVPLSSILNYLLEKTGLLYDVVDSKKVVIHKKGQAGITEETDADKQKKTERSTQTTSSLHGRIVDFETSQPLPGATVKLQGASKTVISDEKGYYTINGIKAGQYNLTVIYTGYADFSERVKISGHETFDVRMQAGNATQLAGVVVSSNKTRKPVAHTSEKQVLEEVKKSSVVVSAISSEQIGKSADRNAAEAIKRVSGVTVVDDKFVIVRGLNQRYNLTYLNDNVAPSTEVNSRAFALDLIPSRIIDKILIYKSSAPENLADATGGVVKIYTKDARNIKHFDIEMQIGVRPHSTFNSDFLINQGGKWDFLGFDDGTRKLPSAVPGYKNPLLANLTPSQYTKVFTPYLTYGKQIALPNMQFTANYYNSFKVFGKQLSLLSSLSYKKEQTKSEVMRQQGIGDFDPNATGITDKNGTDDRNISLVQINLLQNFTLKLHDSSSIAFKNFILQQGQSNTIVRVSWSAGFPSTVYSLDKDIILSYNQRFLYAGNLGGSHYYAKGQQHFKWNAGYTYSNQQLPDQRVIHLTGTKSIYSIGDTAILWRARGLIAGPSAANPAALIQGIISRTWTISNEAVYNFSADNDYHPAKWIELKLGTFQQFKIRQLYRRIYTVHEGDVTNFTLPNYSVGSNGYINPLLVRFREQDLSNLWSDKFFRDDYTGLRVNDNTSGSDSYLGTEQNNSGYVAANIKPFGNKLEIYGGIRYEYNRQKIGAAIPKLQPFFTNTPILIDNPTSSWLPSINITYRPAPSWAIRTAFGKTVNRTEFREVSPFQEYDYENNNILYGNPNLVSARINNYDARVEYYPQNNKKGETISVGAFYKKLKNPIERISTSPRIGDDILPMYTYQNAASATIQGIEFEFRKSLDFIPFTFFRNLSVISSVSLIKSETINDTSASSLSLSTVGKRPLQGQAPYIVNAGLYYDNYGSGTKISVIYNVSGTNIYAAGRGYQYNDFAKGPEYRGSILELPRNLLDVSVTQRLFKSLQLKVSIQNLLNEPVQFAEDYNFDNKYERLRSVVPAKPGDPDKVGDNISSSFNPGRYFIISFSYSL